MSFPQPASLEARTAAFADFDHAIRNPLMIIRGRTQHLLRSIQQDGALTDTQDAGLHGSLTSIERAVSASIVAIDALHHDLFADASTRADSTP